MSDVAHSLIYEREKASLAKADQDIADGERRITAQMVLLDQLRVDGHDTREAEHLLTAMQELLTQFYRHRDEILGRLERLRSGQH